MANFETLEIRHESDDISTLQIQRPDNLNSLNHQVLEEFRTALDQLADRSGLRTLIVEGEGRAFIAGADIKAMVDMSPDEGEAFGEAGHETLRKLETFPVPVLAAVDGFALGGGLEVAVACDLIYASGRAQFGLPEVSLGIIPGFGGTQRLARFVGWQHARELVFTGKQIDADRAEAIGLVAGCFEVDSFDNRIRQLAEQIASRGPLAVRSAKRAMRAGEDLPLEEGLEIERNEFRRLFDSEDRIEGMEAFIERRDPNFEGS